MTPSARNQLFRLRLAAVQHSDGSCTFWKGPGVLLLTAVLHKSPKNRSLSTHGPSRHRSVCRLFGDCRIAVSACLCILSREPHITRLLYRRMVGGKMAHPRAFVTSVYNQLQRGLCRRWTLFCPGEFTAALGPGLPSWEHHGGFKCPMPSANVQGRNGFASVFGEPPSISFL